jgi:type III secretory pathway component EscR
MTATNEKHADDEQNEVNNDLIFVHLPSFTLLE